ncbi:hypothetical protein NX784_08340 [Massilia pinisoli]|uniref:Uncharacterized protein n=1 Tax=Massilia pinisoli TaxID=1772194 RepID=A0ABT1ZPI1_9BURK|nr:hypothetical protein [Massilia pinisoli]MCS0581599.1 hypothetical protein [Massilia pinisoli]
MRTLLVSLPLLAMTIPAHAAWLHQCPAATDGAPPRYVVDGREHAPGCTSVALAPGADVEAVYPLAPGETPDDVIVLNGNVTDGHFAVSEHELPSATRGPARPDPMPLHANLLQWMDARTFGVEERVQAHLENATLRVTCRPGRRPAGAILTGPWFLTRASTVLAATYEAQGSAFTWQAADAAHQASGDALDMGTLTAGAKAARLTLPASLDRAGWRQFVLLCPASEASVDVTALALEPAAAPKAAPRATWVWRPGDWIDGGPALLDWAAGQGIRELFVTVPLTDGAAVRDPGQLAAFVRAAGARGIVIDSVDGDPHMVLPGEVATAVRRARAYAAYNAAQPAEARLRGAQFDVEPYLLPETVLAPARRDTAYVDMARALKAAAGDGLRLEFVVPFWWGGNPALLDALAPYADSLAVMDYRTDRAQVVDFAIPFLDWASVHDRQVRIALEAGPIEPEVQRRYVKATGGPGDLQAIDVGGRQVLVLLRKPVAGADARLYRLDGTRTVDGSATTFHRDKPALLRQLPGLEQEFGLWDGFGGIAIHELR